MKTAAVCKHCHNRFSWIDSYATYENDKDDKPAINFCKQKATGHTKCKLCKLKIRKGLAEIRASYFVGTTMQASGSMHVNQAACKKAKELAAFEKIVTG